MTWCIQEKRGGDGEPRNVSCTQQLKKSKKTDLSPGLLERTQPLVVSGF